MAFSGRRAGFNAVRGWLAANAQEEFPSIGAAISRTAEKCSRCHFTVSLAPTAMGVLRRMQAPDGDVSSRVPGARLMAPAGSRQKTSATAHKTVLGSMIR